MNYKKIKGGITAPKGFVASGIRAGLKENGNDMALIYSKQEDTKVAGLFTTNKCAAAPVKLSKSHCKDGLARAIIVNSGNANACSGEEGSQDALEMVERTARNLGLKEEEVLVASTGVIGNRLPMDKIRSGIKKATEELTIDGSNEAAEAIMTTDTYSKEIAVELEIEGVMVRLGGIAKGSGMIEPNMATMLSFLTTDLEISSSLLKEALREAVNNSFNKITVDGDQSTNDSVIILASGQAGNTLIDKKDNNYYKFLNALNYATTFLAQEIVKDGEGATKFVEVEVNNAPTIKSAEKMARKIANSSLVKTALFGGDPNWGRIRAAIGAVDFEFDLDKLEIKINDLLLLGINQEKNSSLDKVDDLLEDDEVKIEINLNQGTASDKIWTCDLSYDYVKINAEYHT